MITLRAFRLSDAACEGDTIRDLLNDAADDAIMGITVENGGVVAAYGGVRTVHGKHFAFYNLIDPAARKPAMLHRTVKRALAAVLKAGISPVFTPCDITKPRAEVWLRRLGFRPVRQDERDAVIIAIEEITNNVIWIRES